MGLGMISTSTLVAGVLAVGLSLSGAALASPASGTDGATALRAVAWQGGCRGEPETWPPGTLQIGAPRAATRATSNEACVLA